jgi:hypothetical protein
MKSMRVDFGKPACFSECVSSAYLVRSSPEYVDVWQFNLLCRWRGYITHAALRRRLNSNITVVKRSWAYIIPYEM